MPRGRLAVDLLGQKFGRLSVIGRAENYVSPSGSSRAQWRCICDCRREVVVSGRNLRAGRAKSCGCLQQQMVGERASKQRGTDHPRWQGDSIAYVTAHQRLARSRGAASAHLCIDCGAQADDWSYMGGCPRERISEASDSSKGMRYSPDPDRYVARCRSCHKKHDAKEAA